MLSECFLYPMNGIYIHSMQRPDPVDILSPGGESGGKKTTPDLCLLSCLVCILLFSLYLCNLVSGCWSILSFAPLDMTGIRGKRI